MKHPVLTTLALCLTPLAAIGAQASAATNQATTATETACLQPFTASYQVLRKGSAFGVATLALSHAADGSWTFSSRLKATSGLAAFLNGNITETSRFRCHDGRIEALGYEYAMRTAIKNRGRQVHVDWRTNKVEVKTSGDGNYHYAAQPGLVERHVLVLALGRALRQDKTGMSLPVAVKDRVQIQTFAVAGHDPLKLPAGSFEATRVVRTHDDKGYTVWFAPKRLGSVPVKLSQGGGITLLLQSVQRP